VVPRPPRGSCGAARLTATARTNKFLKGREIMRISPPRAE
jgi:hypothetical protein